MIRSFRHFGVAVALVAFGALLAPQTHAQTLQIDLPAQSLESSLRAISRIAQVNVLFDSKLVEGLNAPALTGNWTIEEAVRQLAAGTGLEVQQPVPGTITVSRGRGKDGEETADRGSEGSSVRLAQNARTDSNGAQATTSDKDELNDSGRSLLGGDEDGGRGLEEIVVTGTHIRGVSETAAPSFVITRDDLAKTGYASIEEVFEDIPQNYAEVSPTGRFATEGGSTIAQTNRDQASGVDLRGLGTQSTLTLVNGKRRAGSAGGQVVDISAIPLSAIERVEVATGGRSAIYGSDAVAGVVNLVTRRSFDGMETQIQAGSADRGGESLQADIITGMSGERSGFVLAYDYTKNRPLNVVERGLVTSPVPSSGSTPVVVNIQNDQERHSIFLSGHLALSAAAELYAEGLFASKEIDLHSRERRAGAVNESFTTAAISSDHVAASLGARFDLGGAWMLDVSGASSTLDGTDDSVALLAFGSTMLTSIFSRTQDAKISTATVVADGALFTLGRITPRAAFGFEFRDEELQDRINGVTGADDERTIGSAFAEFVVPLMRGTEQAGSRLELSLAGRYDDYDDFGETFNPQAGLIWTPGVGLSLRGAYSSAFRAPSLNDMGSATVFATIQNVADPTLGGAPVPVLFWNGTIPNLGPEEADTWSLGVDYDLPFGEESRISLSYFKVEYKDRIEFPFFGSADEALALQIADRFPTLIQRGPSPAIVQAVVDNVSRGFGVFNSTDRPWDPTTQNILTVFPDLVIFDARLNNIGLERVSGLDLAVDGHFETMLGSLITGFNANYTIDHDRRLTATSPPFSTLNEPNKPVDFRVRARFGWERRALGAYLYVNHVDSYDDSTVTPAADVASWTTLDLTVRLANAQSESATNLLDGFSAALTVNNLLDKDPPEFVNDLVALRYDPSNANGIGRYISLRLSKRW